MGRSLVGMHILIAIVLVACGDNGRPPIITGTYVADVDVHEKPCGTLVAADDHSDPWFEPSVGWSIEIKEYADTPYPFLYRCWFHTTEDCSVLEATALVTPRMDGWERVMLEANLRDNECSLAYGVMRLTQADDRLTFDLTWNKQVGGIDPAACTETEAVARRASMPCYKHEHVEATLR
jgi:hypothetical protein